MVGGIAFCVYYLFFHGKEEGHGAILLRADRAGERADQLLARLVPELTRSAAQRLLEEGAVTLGGRPVKKNYKAAEGDVLEVRLPEPEPVDVLPRPSPWTWRMRTPT